MGLLRLEAVIHSDRHEALSAAGDAISNAGGWIVDHKLFSDVMAVISFQIPAEQAETLAGHLNRHGIAAAPPAKCPSAGAKQDMPGQLTLIFAMGSGDLRQTVPAFH